VPSGPLHFLGLSSVPRACWHTVGSCLAQTLGRTERRFQAARCLVNFCPPASAQVEKSARKGISQIRCALSNTVICERHEFSRRNLEELVRGASRRALRRIVSQLSRPRAAAGKPSTVCSLPLSVNEKMHKRVSHHGTGDRGFIKVSLSCSRARPFPVVPPALGIQFQVFSGTRASSGKKRGCGLTIRSSGEPTACHQARSTSVVYPTFRGPAGTLSSPA